MGAHQRPHAIGLDAAHKQVRDPQRVEQITCTLHVLNSIEKACTDLLFHASVLAEIEEGENVGMPGFDVDGDGARTLCV